MKKICTILLLIYLIQLKAGTGTRQDTNENAIEAYIGMKKLKMVQQEKLEMERFLKLLGFYESRNNWKSYNLYGYIGEWQMGKAALKETGYAYVTFRKFKRNPYIFPEGDQEKAILKLIEINERLLSQYSMAYSGRVIGNVEITKWGMLAAAHLGGHRGVKEYLTSRGQVNRRDANGTSIADYMLKFSNI